MTTSSTYINGLIFHQRKGQILLPERDTSVFSSPLVNHVGGQLSGVRGPGFSLMLTRFNTPDLRLNDEVAIRDLIGRTVWFEIDGVRYSYPVNGGVKFFVSHARIVWSGVVAAACGYHDGDPYDFQPASKVVTQATFYSVPL